MRISDWSSDVCSSDLSGVTIRLRSGLIPAFLLENIRRALVPREQIGTVLGRDETLQRMNPREQPDEVVLMAVLKRKNRVDQIMANACFTLLNFQPLGKKGFERIHRRAVRHIARRRDAEDRKSTRLNSSHYCATRMPSSA